MLSASLNGETSSIYSGSSAGYASVTEDGFGLAPDVRTNGSADNAG